MAPASAMAHVRVTAYFCASGRAPSCPRDSARRTLTCYTNGNERSRYSVSLPAPLETPQYHFEDSSGAINRLTRFSVGHHRGKAAPASRQRKSAGPRPWF